MNLDELKNTLEAGSGTAYLWIIEGDAVPLLEPGATVEEIGVLVLGEQRIPVQRISIPALRPVDVKIPEGPGNLKARASWFGKRSGPAS